MMHSYIANPLVFLVTTLFTLYILAVMLRFLLGVVRADFYNPVSQFLVLITNPLLVPMRRVLPGIGRVDTASLVLMIVLQLLSLLIAWSMSGSVVSLPALALNTIGELVVLVINIYLIAIVVQVVMSWVSPGSYTPVNTLIYSLTSPLLQPIRRLLPPFSGIDLSPLFAILGLQVLRMYILPLLG